MISWEDRKKLMAKKKAVRKKAHKRITVDDLDDQAVSRLMSVVIFSAREEYARAYVTLNDILTGRTKCVDSFAREKKIKQAFLHLYNAETFFRGQLFGAALACTPSPMDTDEYINEILMKECGLSNEDAQRCRKVLVEKAKKYGVPYYDAR